ncbi:MAG: nitroreductase family protein [Thermodesulfobacteriota bacterium]
MSDLLQALKNRRTVRKFEDKPLQEETLNQILEAARWTQSWANTQCWEIVVVQDPDQKEKLQQTLAKGNPAAKAMVQAPVVLAVCAKLEVSGYYKGQVTTKFGDWFMFDIGLVTQNICLAAHALGLGSVVVGLFEHDQGQEVLQVPAGHVLVTYIPIGYPAKIPEAPKRKELNEFVHFENF